MQDSMKSLGRSLANSSRSRSSQKFVRCALCVVRRAYIVVHRQQTARQVDRQVDRQIHTQTYGDLVNWGEITLCLGCGRILV